VSGSLNFSDTLAFIPFTPMLGESSTSPMNVVDFFWLDGANNPVDYDAETESGTFHLLYGCGDSMLQKFMLTGKTSSITSITPNPTSGIIHIDIQTAEEGRIQLSIVNLLGAKVASVSDGELKPGAHSFNFNMNAVSGGSYFLLMETPTVRKLQRVDVEK
jgi:hypothetical protein